MVGNSRFSKGIEFSTIGIFFYLPIPCIGIEFFVPSTKFPQLFLRQLCDCFFNVLYSVCDFL